MGQDFERHPSVAVIRQAYQNMHFGFNEIKVGAVEIELQKINSSKATGWDGIAPKILKISAKGIAPSLTTLFNTIIRKREWPGTWKMGQWTPLFKKGERTDHSNYRTTTVLNSIDKLFESLFCQQITAAMGSHLYGKMAAYRK